MARSRDVEERKTAVLDASFNIAFIENKNEVGEDIHLLKQDIDSNVRKLVVGAMFSIIPHVPDKKKAWNDLHEFTLDTDSGVRENVAYIIGRMFSQAPDKNKLLDDLHILTKDKHFGVKAFAYHSLGVISILNATEAESKDIFKNKLENAIEYFKLSSEQTFDFNPASFCLPFYQSFYVLTFKKIDEEAEVQKYLEEAKHAASGSESREKLLEVVENLGNALREVQKPKNFDDIKADLNAYRRYCDRACELIEDSEEKAPGASKLIRKGLPIIDERINELLNELKTKSREVCLETKDTPQNEIAAVAYNEIKQLDTENPIELYRNIDLLIESLKMKIPNVKGNEHINEKIEALRHLSNSDLLISKLIPIIGSIPQVIIGRDQININELNGNLNTGDIKEPFIKK